MLAKYFLVAQGVCLCSRAYRLGVGKGKKKTEKEREGRKKRVAIEMGKSTVPLQAFLKIGFFARKINADLFFMNV